MQINAEKLPDFQERIRGDFPLFEEEVARAPAGLATMLKQLALPTVSAPIYSFINEAETQKISLSRDYIALSDVEYKRWEDFRATMKLAQLALEELYKPAFYSRVGLRYRDVIDPLRLARAEEMKWTDLFRAELVGILGSEIAGDVTATKSETTIKLSTSTKASAVIRYGLASIKEPDEEERHVYAIDTDFFTEQKVDGASIFGVLDEFNQLAGNLFRWAITDRLRKALEPRELE